MVLVLVVDIYRSGTLALVVVARIGDPTPATLAQKIKLPTGEHEHEYEQEHE